MSEPVIRTWKAKTQRGRQAQSISDAIADLMPTLQASEHDTSEQARDCFSEYCSDLVHNAELFIEEYKRQTAILLGGDMGEWIPASKASEIQK